MKFEYGCVARDAFGIITEEWVCEEQRPALLESVDRRTIGVLHGVGDEPKVLEQSPRQIGGGIDALCSELSDESFARERSCLVLVLRIEQFSTKNEELLLLNQMVKGDGEQIHQRLAGVGQHHVVINSGVTCDFGEIA